MKNVLIVGSSGMVGSIVLRECLNSPDIAKVTSIVRRPSGLEHPKLTEVQHDNYLDYSELAAHFANQDIAHFCIGVYTGAVPDAKFKEITVDYVQTYADMLKAQGSNVTFCLLSGQGADQKEKSRVSFARYKGMAENYLIAQEFKALYIFRPGYIYPVEKRTEPNFSYRLMRSMYPLMKLIFSRGVITSEELGKGMFNAGLSGAQKMILENQDIKKV